MTGAEQKTGSGQKTEQSRKRSRPEHRGGSETGLDETQLQAMIRKVRELSREKIEAGYKVGVICTDESRDCYTDGEVRSIGARKARHPWLIIFTLCSGSLMIWEWTTYFRRAFPRTTWDRLL